LDEAKRFILAGEVARLRLAVSLLDNAVEVIFIGESATAQPAAKWDTAWHALRRPLACRAYAFMTSDTRS
jgi:hypothetical protein